jgi:hypothetical protein
MFLTVSKSKDRDKIKKVYDLNAFKHFFKGRVFLKKNYLYMRPDRILVQTNKG